MRYRRGRAVITGFSMDVRASSTVALTGASGSGKSTLLYALGLMLRPSEGDVYYRGLQLARSAERDRTEIRRVGIGFVFQDALLDTSMTVADNVLEGIPFTHRRRSREMVARVADLLDQFEIGNLASAPASQLSGGQGQRTALCRALLKDPVLLLADEPTGNLDAASASVVVDALLQYGRRPGRATVIVTHDPKIAAMCDTCIELKAAR